MPKYLVNHDLPQYEDVLIMHEGVICPSGVLGCEYDCTKQRMRAIAASYDITRYPISTLDFDHNGDWIGGPANGMVYALRYEQSGGEGVVLARLVNIPHWLADGIDEGLYPYRSPDWVDAEFLAEVYERKIEACRYYGEQDYYLRKLTFMGQFLPAFPRLGGMPARVQSAAEEAPEKEPLEVIILSAAQHSQAARPLSIAAIQHQPKEEPVPPNDTEHGPTTPSSPTPEGAGEPTLQAAQARIAELEAQQAQLEAAAPADQTGALKAAQARIAELEGAVSRLSARDRENAVEALVTQRMAEGSLTAAQADSYRELALMLHGSQGVKLSASQEVAFQADKHPMALVDRLLASQPKVPYAPQGRETLGRPQGSGSLSASQADAEVARQLGLKPEEIAAERNGAAYSASEEGK